MEQSTHIIHNQHCVIRSNYGDESIALVQWAFEAGLKDMASAVTVVYINTGWAAEEWQDRINRGKQHAILCGFEVKHIQAPVSFPEAVRGRGSFPSAKFQWCTGILKGLPFLDWLDEIDLRCRSIVLIAKRKSATAAHQSLEEWIETCEYHNGRRVWHPLISLKEKERDDLLNRAGFEPLRHRSLECQPCVNSTQRDLKNLCKSDLKKVTLLEKELQTPFLESIQPEEVDDLEKDFLAKFYRGCGNHFGCGL